MQAQSRAAGVAGVDEAIQRVQGYLLGIQYPEGYWGGELESNSTMEAEFLLLTHFLGVGDPGTWNRLASHIRNRQRDDGTWGQYHGAPGDLSTSVECYFALKLAGVAADDPLLRKAREFILSRGGVPNTRVFTKLWLALFGQWDWKGLPAMPPELMLLPTWSPINIYDFASWARATIVPILILLDRKPVRAVPGHAEVDDLYPLPRSQTDYTVRRRHPLLGWESLFYLGDSVLRQLERMPWKPARSLALQKAEQWVLDHQEADGSWGGIQPPWVYSLMALHTLGYSPDSAVMARGLRGFEAFSIAEGDTLRVQACVSPVWDTGLAMVALLDSGVDPQHPSLVKAAQWLLNKQVRAGGDWQVKAKGVPPGGWSFEFENNRYPDLDDTSEVVMALSRTRLPSRGEQREGIERGVRWLLGMQSRNGGWAAFDKDNDKTPLARIPFADFGETVDPPSVDVTAHVLEMMGQLGFSADHPAAAAAIRYILSEQEEDGPWFGRWGVNYIYGTGAVLPALAAIGADMGGEPVRRAAAWLMDRQNADGGWGETCASYADRSHAGRGPSTASQTAWALLALLAAGEVHGQAVGCGVDHLVRTQKADGGWDEPHYTGTGFPGYGIGQRLQGGFSARGRPPPGEELGTGFMINYRLYRDYWPLMALGRYRRALGGESVARAQSACEWDGTWDRQPSNALKPALRRILRLW